MKKKAKRSNVKRAQTAQLTDITPNTFNYNTQSEFIKEKMIASFEEFGFVEPITVREVDPNTHKGAKFEIIGGEHRWNTAKTVGLEEIDIYNLGELSEEKAKKLCIVLNETTGEPDQDALAKLVAEMNDADFDLDVLPYSPEELDDLISIGSDTGTFDPYEELETEKPIIDSEDDEEEEEEADDEDEETLSDFLKLDDMSESMQGELLAKAKMIKRKLKLSDAKSFKLLAIVFDDFLEKD